MRFRKIGVEQDGSLSLRSGEQVAVAVERHRGGGVSGLRSYRLDVDSLRDQEGYERVAQIVKS